MRRPALDINSRRLISSSTLPPDCTAGRIFSWATGAVEPSISPTIWTTVISSCLVILMSITFTAGLHLLDQLHLLRQSQPPFLRFVGQKSRLDSFRRRDSWNRADRGLSKTI